MSERPEAATEVITKPPIVQPTSTTSADAGPLKTVEKPGTGTEKKDGGGPDDTKSETKTTFYGRDAYPDGYVMHHEADGTITLTAPDKTWGRWDAENRSWVSTDGKPMPAGWEGRHTPGTAFDSGPSSSAPAN
jgi:hypothetical protein